MRKHECHPEAGLTLVELTVVVLLAGILTAGLFYMTAGQSRTYQAQLHQLTAQERAWGALEYVALQVRMAGFGFGGCPGGVVNKWNGRNEPYPGNIKKSLMQGLQFFNDCDLYARAKSGAAWPPTACAGGGVDSLAIGQAEGSAVGNLPSVRISRAMPSSFSSLRMTSCRGFQSGDLVVLWDPTDATQPCTLIQVTKKPSLLAKKDCQLRHDPGSPYNPPRGHNVFPPGGYGAGAVAVNIGDVELPTRFAIDKTANPPRLVQWQAQDMSDLEVIADGIEDMQIAYACDENGDNAITEGATPDERRAYPPDEWVNNAAAETSAPTCAGAPIAAVRITLIARTLTPGSKTGFRPAAEDHRAGATSDRSEGSGTHGRIVLTMTVKPRNLR